MTRATRFGLALAAVLVAAPLTGTAMATHEAGWVNAGSGVPGTVDFEETAVSGSNIVAVGSDSADGLPAIYRRAGGGWIADQVDVPVGTTGGKLTDIAAAGSVAWAVGTRNADSLPLIVKASGALSSASPISWSVVADKAGLEKPRSVALSGAAGFIGDFDGDVFELSDVTGIGDEIPPAGGGTVPSVNGLAVHTPGAGAAMEAFAVTDVPGLPNQTPVFNVRVEGTTPPDTITQVAGSPAANTKLVSVAVNENDAIAVEEGNGTNFRPAIWAPGAGGTWTRSSDGFGTDSILRDGAIRDSGATTTEAVVGLQNGTGAIWRREDGGSWSVQQLPASGPALTSVAILGARDIWVVGEDGRVLRYEPLDDPPPPPPDPPVPPDTTIVSGPLGASSDSTPTFSFNSDRADATFECSVDSGEFTQCFTPHTIGPVAEGSHTFAVRAVNADGVDPSPAARTFSYVRPPVQNDDPDVDVTDEGGSDDCKDPPNKLARQVRVRPTRKKIEISFKLVEKAKVKAMAKLDGKVVGKTRKKVLKKGRQKLSFKVEEPPDSVQLIVRPAKTC